MARQFSGWGPKEKFSKQYYKSINKNFLSGIKKHLLNALHFQLNIEAVFNYAEILTTSFADQHVESYVQLFAHEIFNQITKDHKDKMTLAFARRLGVNVSSGFRQAPIDHLIAGKIKDNITLIKTIPKRMHKDLITNLQKMVIDSPENFNANRQVDQEQLQRVLNKTFKQSEFNIRRIARDQNSKLVGQINQIRQMQLGIEGARWDTATDEKVRDLHAAWHGRYFSWKSPPSIGIPGSDVNCRCKAIPILLKSDLERIPLEYPSVRFIILPNMQRRYLL